MIIGRVAEWLGRGLQNLSQRFESARDLEKNPANRRDFFKHQISKGQASKKNQTT